MNRILAIFVIGLGLGGGIGFLTAASSGVALTGHDYGAHDHAGTAEGMEHQNHDEMVEVALDSAPTLSVELIEDPMSGWNLHVLTEDFQFTPENAGATHVMNEGHAHVYVDGVKIARLYGNWMHIAALPDAAEVLVTLNTNDHQTYGVDGKAISVAVVASSAP
ncbi:hypothetical protein [Falsihalocynthiibacter arcticus]|uniref:Uncharacterized protein n=1 Tax=Falsihalocynthiibacter arcticus TaxID=1579316 RepID=A0A126V0V0_9RHOB|nr:hypothetical protein [Falsihalocynthiibacter arcticus]AML51958.1 hypothetical protein RC74_12375 [Falsihalocynthiibacter arcticus]